MDLKLKDKRAFVSGSSRGLGYATALALAKEGCKVAINGRDEAKIKSVAEKMSKESGNQVIGIAGDVSEIGVPEKLIQQIVDAFGGLDILVTNAGGPPAGAFESFAEEAWQKAVDLSLMSHVRLIRAALPYLRKSSAASVLTVTSMSIKQPIVNLVLSNSVRAATGGHLSVNAASEPFQRIEAVFLLEPRENLIFWLFGRLRGRQDELILKIKLHAAPGKESQIEAGRHRDRDFQQAVEKEKSPILESAVRGLEIAHWGKKSQAGDCARLFLEQYGRSVMRLSIRRQSPHVFLRARLKPLLNRPAEDFFSALHDLIVE